MGFEERDGECCDMQHVLTRGLTLCSKHVGMLKGVVQRDDSLSRQGTCMTTIISSQHPIESESSV